MVHILTTCEDIMQTYNFKSPEEMTNDVLKDIVNDLINASGKELDSGKLLNVQDLNRAKQHIIAVIDRNASEASFKAVNDV